MLNTIEITSVKVQGAGWLLNGNILVPNALGNSECNAILAWIAEGNIPEPEFTDAELLEQSNQKKIQEALQYLSSTDWITNKYNDEVIINKSISKNDFITKYSVIYKDRVSARAVINSLTKE
jgi:hypothetical protein